MSKNNIYVEAKINVGGIIKTLLRNNSNICCICGATIIVIGDKEVCSVDADHPKSGAV